MLDLLVIGAGLSGLMGAYTAVKSGLSVKIVTKGLGGALHWSAGTVDVLGYVAGQEGTQSADGFFIRPRKNHGVSQRKSGEKLQEAERLPSNNTLQEKLDVLTAVKPNHPYVKLGAERLFAALDEFKALTEEIGLPYFSTGNSLPHRRSGGRNLFLPSPVGAARPTWLAPAGQIGGDLSRSEPMLIVGFVGMRDFYPQLIAENLNKQGVAARAIQLPYRLLTDRKESGTVQLALELEDVERRRGIITAVKSHLQPNERVGFPAILGMETHAEVLADLQTQLGAPVFEIPTLPPSVPGMRLFGALRRKLLALGVRIEVGMEVVDFSSGSNAVQWVATETSSRPLKHRAKAFLLATGGILGGGFDSDSNGRFWETIFNLPLTVPQKRTEWFRPQFLNPKGHRLFDGGVDVDDEWRAVHDNLWVTGNLLAHCDPIQERSLEGMAIVTGMAAGNGIAAKINQTEGNK